ncbi:MAG: sigma-70 family RNA polymerase sigma factor [Chloroflexaceae bacterium]|jgi:RNA polymerase sigma-70 factor (ECF subfamily)|nr:sigma-70 family RNA polymerase sigma factor [Chloroflexaceae bacterium]
MSLDIELAHLVAQAKSGDVGAISTLYDRYAALMLRYLYARLYDREQAQDLTQEVFIRVIKNIARFEYRDEKTFLGWLYTIASNVLSSYQRRRSFLSTPLDSQEDLVDPGSHQDVWNVTERIALQQALGELTDDQQQVLTLRFFADMTNSEIAVVLNRSEGAIKAIQYRALQSLQRILSRDADSDLPGASLEVGGSAPKHDAMQHDVSSYTQDSVATNDFVSGNARVRAGD